MPTKQKELMQASTHGLARNLVFVSTHKTHVRLLYAEKNTLDKEINKID